MPRKKSPNGTGRVGRDKKKRALEGEQYKKSLQELAKVGIQPEQIEEIYNRCQERKQTQVSRDTLAIKLVELLKYFYMIIDPLSLNKQGEDEGISYRTGIYYTDESELEIIQNFTAEMQKNYDKPIVVEVLPLEHFYDAEGYHQKYLEKNPTGYCHIPFHMFNIAK